ncbi:MAG: hypothetical protein R2713_05665 [Ilumatobacteraceae bacterium]
MPVRFGATVPVAERLKASARWNVQVLEFWVGSVQPPMLPQKCEWLAAYTAEPCTNVE